LFGEKQIAVTLHMPSVGGSKVFMCRSFIDMALVKQRTK